MIDLALKESLGREKSSGNVYLIIDELKLLPKLRHIQNAVNFGRSLGLKVIVGLQSINQLKEAYGVEAENIIAGFSTVMSFHANDYETRKFTTALYGKNIIIEEYKNPDNSLKVEKRDGNCIEDWDVMDLRLGEAIIGLPFTPPFRFRFKEYQ
jgi:type IV secretory pathway TraG/TraD family ATPase VirD4